MEGRCVRVTQQLTPPTRTRNMSARSTSTCPKFSCTVAWPHLPSNTHPATEGRDIAIDQVVIGSCTNGTIEDMAAAAEILQGRHIAKGLRGIVIPATPKVYMERVERGYVKIFMDAGCIVSTPTCGPCPRRAHGDLAAGERAVSTTNRNFVGRMGHTESEVSLASPAVAAASAITGHISHPEGGHGKMKAHGHAINMQQTSTPTSSSPRRATSQRRTQRSLPPTAWRTSTRAL